MSLLSRPFEWLCQTFGLSGLHETGRDAYLIIFARSLRMVAYSCNALTLRTFTTARPEKPHRSC